MRKNSIQQSDRMFLVIKFFLPIAVLSTVLCLIVYLSLQQVFRLSANDPQIQTAEETALSLSEGFLDPHRFRSPLRKIDMSTSLRQYVMVFDDSGGVIYSSVELHGQNPVVPQAVFTFVRKYGEEKFTWQPEAGVRSAAVMVRYTGANSGFVLSGRSLREVENRIDHLTTNVFLGWCVSLLLTFATVLFMVISEPEKPHHHLG